MDATDSLVATPLVYVVIPPALRALCGARPRNAAAHADLELAALTVRELLDELARRYPQVHVRVCDERGEPRPHINVFVNSDHVRARAGLETPLAAGDLVTILPAVSGG